MQRPLFSDEPEPLRVVNVASVPQRSPFRYPGGKTWFIPRLREWLLSQPSKPKVLIEPFVGGGIVSLTAVFENLSDKVLMVDLDEEIAAVWQTIVDGEAEWLARKILSFEMTKDNVIAELQKKRRTQREKAFQTIIKNRTFHGGILASGSGFVKNGENGKGILSRWYPGTLAKRLRNINQVVGKIQFKQGDAFETIDQYKNIPETVFFIDPPYTAGGKKAGSRLYTHFELDHKALFGLCTSIKGDLIMTCDNTTEVKELSIQHGFQAKPISMKNTHHAAMTELVVGKNLDWMRGIDRVLEEQALYQTGKGKNPPQQNDQAPG